MVRTKDLLLIVAVLVMLGMAILATVTSRFVGEQRSNTGLVAEQHVQAPHYEAAETPTDENQREATIERLRRLIAKGDVIESSPSVESSPVPQSEASQAVNCSSPDTGITVARQWPMENVSVVATGLQRVVSHTSSVEAAPSASGTAEMSGVTRTLLQLPISPMSQGEPTCPDSEIIGVTLEGTLIFNGDVVLYQNTGPDTLIGYARDGFPIYGAYGGALDQCGGYDNGTGYRYAVAPAERAFISCFMGQPQAFSL